MTATDMPKPTLTTPVLFLIFNRPDTTAIVFEAIRAARPPRLYVAADGARANRPAEAIKCRETRAIIEKVDWPCEVHTLFREENLGCKRAVSGAIRWFFDNEPEGIVLEDDCLPTTSFFRFCEEMLERYRDDQRIGQIAGTCFFEQQSFPNPTESYVFSRHGSIWGWASWRRAWNNYNVDLPDWQKMTEPRWLNSACPDRTERSAAIRTGTRLLRGDIDTWDYQWTYTKLYYSLLSIVPTRNMILNIGWGATQRTRALSTQMHPNKRVI